MSKVSILIPSRNEIFLEKTVDDIFNKATGDIEVIVNLDGYWPDPILADRPNLTIIHKGRAGGMRPAINGMVAIAKGDFLMKTDAHCMFSEGFDEVLAADCEPDWVSVPRRYSLDAENWTRKPKHPIDYLWLECPMKQIKNPNKELNVRVWNEKNYDKELQKILIDDLFTMQGSCWFMPRDYFYFLELMDDKNYGTFRKEPQEISFKAWLSGGRVVRNKKCWYAHLHKGKVYGRGYSHGRNDYRRGDTYARKWLIDDAWNEKQIKPFRWLIEKFEMPGWDDFDWDNAFEMVDDLYEK